MSYKGLFENAPVGLLRLRLPEGRIELANGKAAELLGHGDRTALEGRYVQEITLADETDWPDVLARLSKSDNAFVELVARRPDGSLQSLRFDAAAHGAGQVLDLAITPVTVHPVVAAVDHLDEAISIYDADDRRIYANRHFREQNAELGETSKLGATFEDYARSLVDTGHVAEAVTNKEDWLRKRMAKHRAPQGRFVVDRGPLGWMQVDEKKLPDGSTIVLSTDITALKQTEIVIGETAARFRRIMRHSPVGAMIVDLDGRYLYVNEKGAKGFGLSRAEMEGRKSHEFYADIKDRDKIVEELRNKGFVNDREALLKRVDGSTFWALISVSHDPDNKNHLIAWYYNIDERHRAHQKLVSLSDAIEAMSEPVAVFDAEDRFVFTNASFREEAEEAGFTTVIGRTFKDHLTVAARSGGIQSAIGREDEWIAERLARHLNPSGPYEISFANGKHFQSIEKKLPGGGSVLLHTNITDLKNTLNELAAAKDQAEIADRAKSEFLATISHELRTPLTSIIGSLGLISGTLSQTLPKDVRALVEMALRNSDTLHALINDLLDFEKILSGNMVLKLSRHDIAAVTSRLLDTVDGYAETHAVQLKLEKPATRLYADIDKHRFEQVLRNLISNATKFSHVGSTVTVRLEKQANRARVNIIDQGVGIPETEMDRIFERFTQVDSSDIRSQNGTGLGLPISKALIESMGGTIGCRSQPGKGSTFFVEFASPDEPAPLS